MRLEPGDQAPDFTLTGQEGDPFTLSESLERRKERHFVYFYPKADTPGCTTQSCLLRDVLPSLAGTVVLGISPDQPEKQAKFDAKYSLGFPLLSDPEHAVAEAYGVWGEKKLYGKVSMGIIRSAFLVGPDGRIEKAWYRISPKDTPVELLDALGIDA